MSGCRERGWRDFRWSKQRTSRLSRAEPSILGERSLAQGQLEEVKMRKQLLLSTGIICCLMLAPGLSYSQAPGGKSEEPKRMQPSEAGKKGAASQERGAERAQERAKGGEQKAQGAPAREERGAGPRQAEEKGKAAPSRERPAAAREDSKRSRDEAARPGEREDARKSKREAQGERQVGREGKDAKGSAEMKRDRAGGKPAAEAEKTKDGTAASQKEREGTAATQKKEREGTTTTQKESVRDRRDETTKDAAGQAKDRPGTASETTRTQTQTRETQRQQPGISTEKQVRISETLTRERLAPPQRNLNISIRAGERIPRHVRVQRLPAAIVSIEPQYRGYDYFTTEEEIVIVEPRTQRIVSHIPRDASRIRAAETGGDRATDSMAAAGGAPCRIMRRDTAGNITEVSPTTVGSTAPQDSLSVTVRAPGGGGSTNPIALGASDGQIVVAMQGGDCTVTIEPQPR